MSHLVDAILDVRLIVTVLAAISAFATIITVTMPVLERDKLGARLRGVALRRNELRQKQREALASKGKSQLRAAPKTFMAATVARFNLRKILESPEIRLKLVQAGFRGQAPIVTFMFFRLVMPFILFFVALLYLFVIKDFGLKPPLRFLAALGGAAIGFYSPDIFITNIIQKRQQSVQLAFPDALDLLLICVESGMSIEAAINKVAEEVGSQSVELAEELALTTAELSYLNDRRQALENLARRTGLEGVKAVVTALVQAERYGTPLGQALRTMAQENRDMRMNAAEKKAGALPAQLTVPMIVFFLPCLFVVILGPAVIQVMHTFK
jgi:tight adherence protein C